MSLFGVIVINFWDVVLLVLTGLIVLSWILFLFGSILAEMVLHALDKIRGNDGKEDEDDMEVDK